MESSKYSDAAQNADNEGDPVANNNQNLEKNNIILREGNVAYEIDRPLFNTDASIDLLALKAEFMKKISSDSAQESTEEVKAGKSLPPIRYLIDQSEEVD